MPRRSGPAKSWSSSRENRMTNKESRAAMVLVTHPSSARDFFLVVEEPNGDILLPGGHVENSETFADAAKRELKEETDLQIYFEDLVPIGAGKGIAEPDCDVVVFLARAVFGTEKPVEQGTNLRWVDWKALLERSSFRSFFLK